MLSVAEMQKKLEDRNLREVGKRCDVPYSAMRRLKLGNVERFSLINLQKLSDYLNNHG